MRNGGGGGRELNKGDGRAYLWQDVLTSELSHDEAVLIGTFFVLSFDDDPVVACLDVDFFWLKMLHIQTHAKFLFVVDDLNSGEKNCV